MGEHGVVDQPGVGDQVGVAEAVAGEGQGRRRQQVGVSGRFVVDDAAVRPTPRQQAIVALQVLVGPRPQMPQALLVAEGDGQQHAVCLALADRVAALVGAGDPPTRLEVAIEELVRRDQCLCPRVDRSGLGTRPTSGAPSNAARAPDSPADRSRRRFVGVRPLVVATAARLGATAAATPWPRIATWRAANATLFSVAASLPWDNP